MPIKKARTDHPIHNLLTERWSPCAFDDRPVDRHDLLALFEGARWAPSSYNEQPWNYIVATKENPEDFARLLSCLNEKNQTWAGTAPVLALGVTKLKLQTSDILNRAALHDLGLATACLLVEATSRGLSVHQMIGILPDKARELFDIPTGYEVLTAIAIGYRGDPQKLPETFRKRDLTARQRKPLSAFLFSGKWGAPSPLIEKP